MTILFIILLNQAYISLLLDKKIEYRKVKMYDEFISNPANKNLDYVFFGDSHAENAINPLYIKNSYNFAIGAENYIKSYYKLKKIIKKDNITIKNIVLEVDMQTFSERTVSEGLVFDNLYLYRDYISLNNIKKIRKDDSIYKFWIEENFPVIGNGEEFRFIYFRDLSEIDLGWLNNTGNFSTAEKEISLQRVYDIHYNHKKRIANLTFEYFLKTLELAKENNISIILIKYPQSKEFDGYITERNVTKDDYYDYIFKEVDSMGINYRLLDYYDEYFNHTEYFGDPDHLNYVGSKIFSKKVNDDFKNYKK